MELYLMDSTFKIIHVLDVFKSFIWTDRYNKYGDFEIELKANDNIVKILNDTFYIKMEESDHTMIKETLNLSSDVEDFDKILVKGRSLESILDRRIVWETMILNGSFQNKIIELLNAQIINPTINERKIDNFYVETSTDSKITNLTINRQFTGDNLYDVITELCYSRDVGFRITLTNTNNFEFNLYAGSDRSFGQLENPYVVFSPKYDNLLNSDYVKTNQFLKTIALVGGEAGVGNGRVTTIAESPNGAGSGLDRREIFKDARDLTRTTSSGTISDEEYFDKLEKRGLDELSRNIEVESFDGQAEISVLYKYKEDFFMGDILQIADDYGHEGKSRLTEIIYSQDESGISLYPTFSSLIEQQGEEI